MYFYKWFTVIHSVKTLENFSHEYYNIQSNVAAIHNAIQLPKLTILLHTPIRTALFDYFVLIIFISYNSWKITNFLCILFIFNGFYTEQNK